MRTQSPHAVTSLVIRNVRSLATRQNQQKRGPLGNSRHHPAKRLVSALSGERDSSRGGSSTASTIHGQNSTPSSLLNNSRIADITLSATQWRSIPTPTATLGTSSRNTPAPSGTSQIDSTRHVVPCPASGIANSPTPLSSLVNLPTPIPNPEACAIIPNPLWIWATERNQRQRQWHLQTQEVSIPRSVVSSSRSIHRFLHSDMTRPEFAIGRLLELYMWNRQPFMSASDLETVSYATRCIATAVADAPHW